MPPHNTAQCQRIFWDTKLRSRDSVHNATNQATCTSFQAWFIPTNCLSQLDLRHACLLQPMHPAIVLDSSKQHNLFAHPFFESGRMLCGHGHSFHAAAEVLVAIAPERRRTAPPIELILDEVLEEMSFGTEMPRLRSDAILRQMQAPQVVQSLHALQESIHAGLASDGVESITGARPMICCHALHDAAN